MTMPIGSHMSGIIAAKAMRTDRSIVQRLRQAGATSASRAMQLESLTPFQRRRLLRLERHGVIRMGAPDRWFLDERAWDGLQRSRRWSALAALALMAVTIFFLILWSGRGTR
jgi:hypothetical protein